MSVLATVVTVGVWAVVGVLAYAVLAYVLLFYLRPADRLSNGAVTDVVFVATVPFVLAVTWLATVRR